MLAEPKARTRKVILSVATSSSCCRFAVVFLLVSCIALHGQSDPPGPDPVSAAVAPSQSSSSSAHTRDVSVSLLPTNILRDQETMWSFPLQLVKGRQWSPTVTVVAATVALLSADPYVDPYFNHTTAFHGFDRAFGSNLTGAETAAVPTALYLIGLDTHDPYMQKTALFAGEAVFDSEMLRMFMNSVTNRWRPQDIFARRSYADTFFQDRSRVGSSFPSGHMIAAVSVATVIARRYRHHRWVPWAAYGVAGAIGLSRISLRAHFPSDVFLGTVLGYAIARYDVLQTY
jgi:membrane-associated phospholipid phosphatase